jgi:SNF2 family DNA or RNA helicase
MDAVIEKLIERKDNKNGKIIFCHYTGEIDMLKEALVTAEIKVNVLDGRISQAKRNALLAESPENVVFIIQIQTGCEGLNLQNCNEIYFVSPHWNPSVEDQAVARCHRMGQEKPVFVFKFVMNRPPPPTQEMPIPLDDDHANEANTLDQYCLKKQMEKRAMMETLYEITNGTEKK